MEIPRSPKFPFLICKPVKFFSSSACAAASLFALKVVEYSSPTIIYTKLGLAAETLHFFFARQFALPLPSIKLLYH